MCLFQFDKAGRKEYGYHIYLPKPKYQRRRDERMYLNIVIVVFCVAVIAMGIFAVVQMVRNSKKGTPRK